MLILTPRRLLCLPKCSILAHTRHSTHTHMHRHRRTLTHTLSYSHSLLATWARTHIKLKYHSYAPLSLAACHFLCTWSGGATSARHVNKVDNEAGDDEEEGKIKENENRKLHVMWDGDGKKSNCPDYGLIVLQRFVFCAPIKRSTLSRSHSLAHSIEISR